MPFIKGNFKKYIFTSDKGYVVGLFKIKDTSSELIKYKNSTTIFTGYFTDLNESDLYIFNGNFISHPKYGEQFNCDSYEVVLPEDKDNIVEFLSSNIFPGIGEKKAIKIVDVLGDDTFNVIMNNPDSLLLVPGITIKQKNVLHDNLVKYQSSYLTIVELTKYGFSTKDALAIYNVFKDKAVNIILDDPYLICSNIREISFKKIDLMRKNFDILDNDSRRVRASIKYIMEEISFSLGNTYLSYEEIIYYTKRYLFNVSDDMINSSLEDLIEVGEIVKLDDKYFLYMYYEEETYIASRVCNLANNMILNKIDEEEIKYIEKDFNLEFNDEQKKAIFESLKNNFCVITGGPGTGKTTIIKAICKMYQNINGFDNDKLLDNLALLAPTGRAAKRISEDTMLPAYTIHRFLKWNKEDNNFRINEDNKSSVKLVIVDEVSMVDVNLFYNLLLGINYNTKIVLIGDYNQLPSVGAGNLFKDIIDSDCVNVVRLEKLYRQKESSNINLFARDILKNKLDLSLFNNSDDLTFIEAKDDDLKEVLKDFVITYKDLDFNKFQVLAPVYKKENGIDDLNYFIQDILNSNLSNKNSLMVEGVEIRENDKILQLVNDPDNNVYNGDIGEVIRIKDKDIFIDYNDNIVKITTCMYSNIKLGYVISIHKSQGSEFDVVVIIVLNKFYNMLYKKLIYTAVTRARKKLIILGEVSALKRAISNEKEENRKTNLKNFILDCIKTN